MRDGRIVEVMEVVGVEGSRVLFERFLPLHDTVLKRYRVASAAQRSSARAARELEQRDAPRRAAASHRRIAIQMYGLSCGLFPATTHPSRTPFSLA